MITNSGSQRFDLYSGPFTKNDQLTSSPFADSFLYIPNVTYSVASQVVPFLNKEGSNNRRDLVSEAEHEEELYKKGYVGKRFRRWLEDMDRRAREDSVDKRDQNANATLGYVTTDVRYLCSRISFHSLTGLHRVVPEQETIPLTNRCHSTTSPISSSRTHPQT